MQMFRDESTYTAMMTLMFDLPPVSAWLGGKLGDEYRPVYLTSFVVYDIAERIPWGLWAGIRVHVSSHLDASAVYSFDRMNDPVTSAKSSMHYLSLGPVINF
jgi:hypothetical protein